MNILPISRRVGLINMFKDYGFRTGVEVGTDHGEYAKQLLEGIPNLHLYCVDPWTAYTEGDDVKSQEDVDKIYDEAKARLEHYSCEIIRKTSMEAVKDFRDNSLDFVFIDGNHEYKYVLEDIAEWTKKVRPGGIVCGHDYKEDPKKKYGVVEAINKYAKENNIKLSILRKGTFVDCWLFFKQ